MQLKEKKKKKDRHSLKQKAKERYNGGFRKSPRKNTSFLETRRNKYFTEGSPRWVF